MAATETVYLRLDPVLKDRLARAARREKRSLNAELILRLERSLASGAGAKGSAGLPDVSASVASDGALAERPDGATRRERPPQSEPFGHGAGESEGTGRVESSAPDGRSASAPEPPPLSLPMFGAGSDLPPKPAKTPAELAASFPGVSTARDLAKKQVTPHLKQEQAGRKK